MERSTRLNATTGRESWKYQIEDQIRCSPTIVEGRAFLAGCDSKLHVLDVNKGEAISSIPIESQTGSTPAVLGDLVYFGSEGGIFYAVNWREQEVAWRFQDKSRQLPIRSSAAVTSEAVYFGGQDKQLHAVDPRTGERLWKFPTRGQVNSSPVVVGQRVYFGSADGRVYGLNRTTGEKEWEYEMGGRLNGAPAIADGRLLIASEDGRVYCFGKK